MSCLLTGSSSASVRRQESESSTADADQRSYESSDSAGNGAGLSGWGGGACQVNEGDVCLVFLSTVVDVHLRF